MTKSKLPKSKMARRRFLRRARKWGRTIDDMAVVGKYTIRTREEQ